MPRLGLCGERVPTTIRYKEDQAERGVTSGIQECAMDDSAAVELRNVKKVFAGVTTLHEINRVTFVEEVNIHGRP